MNEHRNDEMSLVEAQYERQPFTDNFRVYQEDRDGVAFGSIDGSGVVLERRDIDSPMDEDESLLEDETSSKDFINQSGSARAEEKRQDDPDETIFVPESSVRGGGGGGGPVQRVGEATTSGLFLKKNRGLNHSSSEVSNSGVQFKKENKSIRAVSEKLLNLGQIGARKVEQRDAPATDKYAVLIGRWLKNALTFIEKVIEVTDTPPTKNVNGENNRRRFLSWIILLFFGAIALGLILEFTSYLIMTPLKFMLMLISFQVAVLTCYLFPTDYNKYLIETLLNTTITS
jgi:hypothetical protein